MSFPGRPRTPFRAALIASAAVAVLASLLVVPPVPGVAGTPVPMAATTRTAVLRATAQTYTDSRHPRTSYAKKAAVRVSRARYSGYLSFPAVALAPGEAITGATLTLRVTKANRAAAKGGIVVRPVTADWAAAQVTGGNAPAVLATTMSRAVRARKGNTLRIGFSADIASAFLAEASALRLGYSTSGADVRLAKKGAAAPTLTFTIATTAGVPTPAPPAATGTAPFSFAVLPDTQQETMYTSNPKFAHRTKWLVDNRRTLNLAYVLHTGDVVNWGWLVPLQFGVAKKAIKNLEDAGIPYALTIGNHDTAAVGWNGRAGSSGYGGSAYAYNPECKTRLSVAECRTRLLVRKTAAFNQAFPLASIDSVGGAFEQGKVDNIWTTFEASETKWLVLTLELWPRTQVIDWAARVAASHPTYNVIIQTHSYLTASGAIVQNKGGYGSNTGQYLFDHLVEKYANIKLVFSGHTGTAARRVDTGVHGNRIVSYLQTFHSNSTNPMRIVTVNPVSGVVTSRIIAPYTGETWTRYSTSDKIALVR